jgi:hypothetical protein
VALPAVPNNLYVQQGNGQVYLQWDASAGASSYSVLRSSDNISFAEIGTPTVPNYLDATSVLGTRYYYQVASVNSDGTSPATASQAIVAVLAGQMTLEQVRLAAQQRADRVNSSFVSLPEWNSYINQSYMELYDLLVTTYEDYYVKVPYQFTSDGTTFQYTLPTDFYKLMGVDLGLSASGNGFVTVRNFDFMERNSYVFPNISSTYAGVFNLRYRLVGNSLMFIPTPSAGQIIQVWYVPRVVTLLQDTDILDGVSGWTEYVIVDAAIKALEKEESPTDTLMVQKAQLIKRIEESAMNRDIGEPNTISNLRRIDDWGGDGNFGGY